MQPLIPRMSLRSSLKQPKFQSIVIIPPLYECICSFIQHIIVEHQLCAGHYSRHTEHVSEQNRHIPCPRGAYILMVGEK